MIRIDLATMTCRNCGHICTSPEALNAMPNQMDTYDKIPPLVTITKDGQGKDVITEESALGTILDGTEAKTELETIHQGNTFTIQKVGKNETVIKLERSYATAIHDKTELAESNEIILKCPQCGNTLCEVRR